jgi:hypothetical protein
MKEPHTSHVSYLNTICFGLMPCYLRVFTKLVLAVFDWLLYNKPFEFEFEDLKCTTVLNILV